MEEAEINAAVRERFIATVIERLDVQKDRHNANITRIVDTLGLEVSASILREVLAAKLGDPLTVRWDVQSHSHKPRTRYQMFVKLIHKRKLLYQDKASE